MKLFGEYSRCPGTKGGPGGGDRTAAKRRKNARKSISGETNFLPREFPRSGSKAKDGGKKRKEEREREKD